jgi:signal transduction histidine kinase
MREPPVPSNTYPFAELEPAPNTGLVKILMVEDSSADSELVRRELRRSGFPARTQVVQTQSQFLAEIENNRPDIVLADYNLGQWRGMDALETLRQKDLDIPLILVSGALGDVTAVECIKQGATDYVLKDALARLPISIVRALREKTLRVERRKALEELDAKVKELARSNEELEQFAYAASHDLQEPLRMVASYTQLLAERYGGKLDEQAHKYIRYAVEGAGRMQTLIQDLLKFSRVGRQPPELTTTDCEMALAGALENLQAAIQENNAVIQHEPLPIVRGNAVQLQQLFQNLLGNAMKFRNSETPVIRITAAKRGEDWLFSLQDNGIGIAPEHAEGVFTIFTRLHTRAEYTGNGIGLAICKKIVEQHRGSIWVQPHTGSGAIFCFTLPAANAAAPVKPHEEMHPHDLCAATSAGG